MEVMDGYKMTEVGVIPKDWEVNELRKYTSFISYGFTNPMPIVEDGIFMVTAANIADGKIQYKTSRYTTESAYDKLLTPKSKPKVNDVLLTKDGSLGRLALVQKDNLCINQSVAILRPNKKITPLFFKLLLESPFYQQKMLDDAGGSTIKHIYITIVDKMLIGIPPILKEQKAIANALSDMDDLVQSLDQLIAKKRAIKQGAMQQLLTPPSEGGKRLAEFSEDWKEICLNKLIDRDIRYGVVQPGQFKHNGCLMLRSQDYSKGWTNSEKMHRISKLLELQYKNARIKFQDLVITIVGAGVGQIAEVPNWLDGAILSRSTGRIAIKSELASSKYVFFYLSSNLGQEQLLVNVKEGAQPVISSNDIGKCVIPLPSIKEQTTIAKILSDMDNEIHSLENQRAKYQQLKEGMMQELLTGKIRLV